MTARALSVQQPWAWAITDLDKRVENRAKPTSFCGEVFLHASAKARDLEDLDCVTAEEYTLAEAHKLGGLMPLGAIVGVAEVIDCASAESIRNGLRDIRRWLASPQLKALAASQERWIEGPYCYLLENVIKLPRPVPCKGALGFWTVPADVEAEVRKQLEETAVAKKKKSKANPDPLGTAAYDRECEAMAARLNAEAAAGGAGVTTDPPADALAAADPGSAKDDVDARAELGYTGESGLKPLTPEQQKALRETRAELSVAESELAEARLVMSAAVDKAKEAKKAVNGKAELVQNLLRRLAEIIDGGPYSELPGMDPVSAAQSARGESTDPLCVCGHPESCHVGGSGECRDEECETVEKPCRGFTPRPAEPKAAEIPEDLWRSAFDHIISCQVRGKGLDLHGLSLALFGNYRKEHRATCEAVVGRMVAEGLVVADPTCEDGKPRWLPAGKGE